MIGEYAVVEGGEVEIFDDLFIELFYVDLVFIVDVGFDVLDDFEDDVSVEDEFFVSFLSYLLVNLFED